MFALVLRPLFALGPLPLTGRRARLAGTTTARAAAPLGPDDARRFRAAFLPLLDAAYGYARTLTRDATAAEDLVQDAYLRACRSFHGYRGGEPKAWLFAIVRSTFLTGLRGARGWDDLADAEAIADPSDTPEERLIRDGDTRDVRAAIDALPDAFREAIVLRELQELSYREIAAITGAPIGTVMSRLARGRQLLAASLGLEAAP